jgi:hypothetical protein
MRDGNNKSIQFNPGHNAEKISYRPADSQNLPVMQRRTGRKNTVDPFEGFFSLFCPFDFFQA